MKTFMEYLNENEGKITYSWSDRHANEYSKSGTRKELEDRLASLEKDEKETSKKAPTDSGGVRYNCNAEAEAIRNALK